MQTLISLWRNRNFFWFDWITRDFFAHLYHRANTLVYVPGTLEPIFLGDAGGLTFYTNLI